MNPERVVMLVMLSICVSSVVSCGDLFKKPKSFEQKLAEDLERQQEEQRAFFSGSGGPARTEFSSQCDAGNAFACYNLAKNWEYGDDDGPTDCGKARFYYHKSCELKNGLGCEQFAEFERRDQLKERCAATEVTSCSELGFLLRQGTPCLKDEENSLVFLKKGCNSGDERACAEVPRTINEPGMIAGNAPDTLENTCKQRYNSIKALNVNPSTSCSLIKLLCQTGCQIACEDAEGCVIDESESSNPGAGFGGQIGQGVGAGSLDDNSKGSENTGLSQEREGFVGEVSRDFLVKGNLKGNVIKVLENWESMLRTIKKKKKITEDCFCEIASAEMLSLYVNSKTFREDFNVKKERYIGKRIELTVKFGTNSFEKYERNKIVLLVPQMHGKCNGLPLNVRMEVEQEAIDKFPDDWRVWTSMEFVIEGEIVGFEEQNFIDEPNIWYYLPVLMVDELRSK